MGQGGFALAYSLIVCFAFLIFFSSFVLLSRDTMRAAQYDEQLVKAKLLAATGNELAFHLLGQRSDDWYNSDFSFSNDPEAHDYFPGVDNEELKEKFSPQSLGGTFRVRLIPVTSPEAEGLEIPQSGTFRILQSVGKVGRVETKMDNSSRLLVKIGSPYVNNLACAKGSLSISDASWLQGPVFVGSGENDPGTMTILAHTVIDTAETGEILVSLTSRLGIDAKLRGNVELINYSYTGDILDRVPLRPGTYPAGSRATIPPPALAIPFNDLGIGGVEFTRDSTFAPQQSLEPHFPSREEILSHLASLHSGSPVDTAPYSDGVLLEFDGSRARLYEMRRERIGRVYDLSLLTSCWDAFDLVDIRKIHLEGMYGAGAGGYRAGLLEVAWNDPFFPEARIPEALRLYAWQQYRSLKPGAQLSEIPLHGNYVDLFKPAPGPQIAQWDLSRDQWTDIRLIASRFSALDGKGKAVAPPLFVRGTVNGKAIVAYDLAQGLMPDPNSSVSTYCDIVVVSEPDRGRNIAGGLRLTEEVFASAEEQALGSPDRVMLVSRGAVKPWGLPMKSLGWVAKSDGTRLDLRSQMRTELSERQIKVLNRHAYTEVTPPIFSGVSCGGWQNSSDVVSCELKATPESDELNGKWPKNAAVGRITWSVLDPTSSRDSFLLGTNSAVIPWALRMAYRPFEVSWVTNGAHATIEGRNSHLAGDHVYDYSWRSLDADEIQKQIGLPLSLMLLDRQGP